MPRQKFCSVPGCLSTTEAVRRDQQAFLDKHCDTCDSHRPCRCPAPDIYTTRRETRSKFDVWSAALGLTNPGYYINVCYKHFSLGGPTRARPVPDRIQIDADRNARKRDRGHPPESERQEEKRAKDELEALGIANLALRDRSMDPCLNDGHFEDAADVAAFDQDAVFRWADSFERSVAS